MIGTTLSHYRITEKLGAGGMGEVYRAEDTNLDREAAIKVLPDTFSGDPERLARFEREAKLLASLNHPNIAAIQGLEEAGGKRYLALELVEGQTLAERLHKGPLPVDEALEVCKQIAEGLEAAHEKGVIHRDLKPANIKISPEGKVKILDFGLAKAFHEESAVAELSHSPTVTETVTRAGVIPGTAACMSPEQTRGKPVDKKSDIWAFGCVLYEMLTGKKAFGGDAVLGGFVQAELLEAIGSCLVTSDAFHWDSNSPEGERAPNVEHDWSTPKIDYPLTLHDVAAWRQQLLGEEAHFETKRPSPDNSLEQTAGSQLLAAAAQRQH